MWQLDLLASTSFSATGGCGWGGLFIALQKPDRSISATHHVYTQ